MSINPKTKEQLEKEIQDLKDQYWEGVHQLEEARDDDARRKASSIMANAQEEIKFRERKMEDLKKQAFFHNTSTRKAKSELKSLEKKQTQLETTEEREKFNKQKALYEEKIQESKEEKQSHSRHNMTYIRLKNSYKNYFSLLERIKLRLTGKGPKWSKVRKNMSLDESIFAKSLMRHNLRVNFSDDALAASKNYYDAEYLYKQRLYAYIRQGSANELLHAYENHEVGYDEIRKSEDDGLKARLGRKGR